MAVVTTRQLLESGVHFGHQTRRWNPKMKRFIFTERNGIYIIDLQQSLTYIDRAYAFVKDTVARGGQVLFVGTKKQAQEAIAEQATRVGMPYVNQRWLGGMLTNFHTVIKRIQRLKELEGLDFDDIAASGLTKKELLGLRREKEKLERTLGGIRDMTRPPQAVWIVDTKKEHLAVDEARKLRIPVIGILDTNCDPDEVDFAIPGNDDAIRSVSLLTRVLADMERTGIGADLDYLVGLQAEFAAQVKAVEQEAYAAVGREFNLGSPKQLQTILFDELKLPKTKRIKSGYTTDADALVWLSEQAPDVPLLAALLRHRDVSRLKTVVDSLIPMVDDHGRIHTTFNQVIAATAASASSSPPSRVSWPSPAGSVPARSSSRR